MSAERRLKRITAKYERYKALEPAREMRREMRHHLTTTKIVLTWLIVNCTAVEIYSMVAMYRLFDLSALYALIAAVVTETISFAVYCAKAYSETKQEESIKLERDKMHLQDDEDKEAVG